MQLLTQSVFRMVVVSLMAWYPRKCLMCEIQHVGRKHHWFGCIRAACTTSSISLLQSIFLILPVILIGILHNSICPAACEQFVPFVGSVLATSSSKAVWSLVENKGLFWRVNAWFHEHAGNVSDIYYSPFILWFAVLHVDQGSKTGIYLSLFHWACSIKAILTYVGMVYETVFVCRCKITGRLG